MPGCPAGTGFLLDECGHRPFDSSVEGRSSKLIRPNLFPINIFLLCLQNQTTDVNPSIACDTYFNKHSQLFRFNRPNLVKQCKTCEMPWRKPRAQPALPG